MRLKERVVTFSYSHSCYRSFVVNDSKKRLINAPAFEDHVLHHMVFYFLEEVFQKYILFNSIYIEIFININTFSSICIEMRRKTYEDYVELGSIKDLEPSDKPFYIDFLQKSYKEDLENSRDVISSSPKWSIISGYYAMHNVTKYYLALKFNKKIGLPDVHEATINATKELIKNKEIKELIDIALFEYEEIIPVHYSLIGAKKERKNLQYYTDYSRKNKELTKEKADYFLNKITEKYIELIELLMKND